MKISTLAGGALAAAFVAIAAVGAVRMLARSIAEEEAADAGPVAAAEGGSVRPAGSPAPSAAPSATPAPPPGPAAYRGFLYGRVGTVDGTTYEGRLRFGEGGGEEAFWSDAFNGVRTGNAWAALVPRDKLPQERDPIELFGVELFAHVRPLDLRRELMVPFGDVTRVESAGTDVQVTLKSGAVVHVNRTDASDFDDGLRVWDRARGVVDLDSLRVRTIEFLPTPALAAVPARLHGTVRTAHGTFTGFVQWNRDKCLATDTFIGHAAAGARDYRFADLRAIVRRGAESVAVTLQDGSEVVLSRSHDTGRRHRGIVVDDPRFGRVVVSWGAFERVDFTPADGAAPGSGPGYEEFAPGRALAGTVTTRAGARLAGRLVYDLDESETIEALDAPASGVDYTIPFDMIASIAPAAAAEDGRVPVVLVSGEELRLEPAGDLGPRNAGLLVFVDGREPPEYVSWGEVARIELQRWPIAGR